jgi:hypothetical protein
VRLSVAIIDENNTSSSNSNYDITPQKSAQPNKIVLKTVKGVSIVDPIVEFQNKELACSYVCVGGLCL